MEIILLFIALVVIIGLVIRIRELNRRNDDLVAENHDLSVQNYNYAVRFNKIVEFKRND